MGKIPLYQQGQIASSRVGTPGVSQTGGQIEALGGEVLKYTQQYIQAEAVKREIADNIEADKHRVEFENQYYRQLEQRKQQSVDDPYAVLEGSYGLGSSLVNEMASGISNERVRLNFQKKANESITGSQSKIRNWAFEQTSTNAFVNYETAMQGLATQAAGAGNLEDLDGLYLSAEKLMVNAIPVVGVEKARKSYETNTKAIADNFIYSKIDDAPGTVEQYLDSGFFDGVYNEKEKVALRDKADSIRKKNEYEAFIKQDAGNAEAITGLYAADTDGSLTLGMIENTIAGLEAQKEAATNPRFKMQIEQDIRSAIRIKDDYLKPKAAPKLTPEQKREKKARDAEMVYGLDTDFSTLVQNVQGEYETPTGEETVELRNLREKYEQAYLDGAISLEKRNKELKNIDASIKDALFKNGKIRDFGWFENKEANMFNQAKNVALNYSKHNIKDEMLRNQFYGDVMEQAIDMIDTESQKPGFSVDKFMEQIIEYKSKKYGFK